MLNQVILVGRIEKIEMSNDNTTLTVLTIKIPRYFKNEEGIYENDIIEVKLSNVLAENSLNYCKVGDLVGIKGRIESQGVMEIQAEKITFLSTKSE